MLRTINSRINYFVYVFSIFVSMWRTWRCRYTFHRRLVNYHGRVASCGDLVSPDTCTRCATSIYTVGTQLGTSHGWWALAGRGKRLLVIVICHLSSAIRPTMSAWEMANSTFGSTRERLVMNKRKEGRKETFLNFFHADRNEEKETNFAVFALGGRPSFDARRTATGLANSRLSVCEPSLICGCTYSRGPLPPQKRCKGNTSEWGIRDI